jgi:hypothetical protein
VERIPLRVSGEEDEDEVVEEDLHVERGGDPSDEDDYILSYEDLSAAMKQQGSAGAWW